MKLVNIVLILMLLNATSCVSENKYFDKISYTINYSGADLGYAELSMIVDLDKNVFIMKRQPNSLLMNRKEGDNIFIEQAKLDDETFNMLFSCDINNIKLVDPIVTDFNAVSLSFVKNQKIVKSINGYQKMILSTLSSVIERLARVNDTLIFKDLKTIEHPPSICTIDKSFGFKDQNKKNIKSDRDMYFKVFSSDAYLLSNYLCNGTLKDTIFQGKRIKIAIS